MNARELMTPAPFAVTPTETVARAARLMADHAIGSLPVVDDYDRRGLIGMITDRDIVVRCVANSHSASCPVASHMTALPLHTVHAADDLEELARKMEVGQVRRIPVISGDNTLIGIVAQADLATKVGAEQPKLVEEVVARISAPLVAA